MATSWHPSPVNISKRCQHFEHFILKAPRSSSSICNGSEANKKMLKFLKIQEVLSKNNPMVEFVTTNGGGRGKKKTNSNRDANL